MTRAQRRIRAALRREEQRKASIRASLTIGQFRAAPAYMVDNPNRAKLRRRVLSPNF